MKGLWKKINKRFTTPLLYYGFLFVLSLIMIIVTTVYLKDMTFKDIVINIGYGIFGSTFVALLVDYGATKRQRKNEEKQFLYLTKSLKFSIHTLVIFRITAEKLEKALVSEYAYDTWIQGVIALAKEDFTLAKDCIDTYLYLLSVILLTAKDIRYRSGILEENQYTPANFTNDIDFLIHFIEAIEDTPDKKYPSISFCTQNILRLITNLFPEYKSIFFEKWNGTEMRRKFDMNFDNSKKVYKR